MPADMKFGFGMTMMAFCSLVPSASATVQATRCDPPLSISAWYQIEGPNPFNLFAIDFDSDGQADLRLTYGCCGGIGCYFSSRTRIAIRKAAPAYPGQTNVYGSVAGLPLGTVVGSNLVSSVDLNRYAWHPGNTNRDDLTQAYGDHSLVVLS